MTTDRRLSDRGIYGVIRELRRNRGVYLLALPVLAYYILFAYVPMYGVVMAFKNYSPRLGILGSQWVGLKHFEAFFGSFYFMRTLRNTFLMSFYSLLFGFPAPIILAILLNEIKNEKFKRICQTMSYLPYFVSIVVICGLIRLFVQSDGLINNIASVFGGTRMNYLGRPEYFRTIYVLSGIWQNIGWGSIIFLSAIAGINPELYESAEIDGANRFQRILHITLPGIQSITIIMLILNCGNLLSIGYEKIILLYSSSVYETADVISTYVYRKGLQESNYGYSTAVGLFNSIINFILLATANAVSRRVSETSLF